METHREIDEKPLQITQKKKSEVEKKINEDIFYFILFSIKKRIYRKNAISKILSKFRDIDKKHKA